MTTIEMEAKIMIDGVIVLNHSPEASDGIEYSKVMALAALDKLCESARKIYEQYDKVKEVDIEASLKIDGVIVSNENINLISNVSTLSILEAAKAVSKAQCDGGKQIVRELT